MSEAIICALITGGLAVFGTWITCKGTENKIQTELKVNQAVSDQKITELTREVREHNEFAKRMPAIEIRVEKIEKHLGL